MTRKRFSLPEFGFPHFGEYKGLNDCLFNTNILFKTRQNEPKDLDDQRDYHSLPSVLGFDGPKGPDF